MLQAAAEKSISLLPPKPARRVNAFFQRYVTKGTKLDERYFEKRVKAAQQHLRAYQAQHAGALPRNSLELGMDKHLLIPISLFLMGVHTTYLVDVSMLSNRKRLLQSFQKFKESYDSGKLQELLDLQPERWEQLLALEEKLILGQFQEVLEGLGLRYLVQDARILPFPNESIDLIHSHHVFEHLSPPVLKDVLLEFKRLVDRERGLFSHLIDLSDDFARFDSNISIYNFLRFSEERWRYINSRIHPQNRWRVDDYRCLYAQLAIPIQEERKKMGDLSAVQKLKLASPFADKPLQTLAVSHCHLISRLEAVPSAS